MTLTVAGQPEPVTLFPCSKDAYLVVSDLNHLAQGEFAQAQFLDLPTAPKITFCLELLESVLTYHVKLFQSPLSSLTPPDEGASEQGATFHPELTMILNDMTCPMLIGALSTSHGIELAGGGLSFSIQVRLVRLLYLLLRKFSAELRVQAEVLLNLLLRMLPSKRLPRQSSDFARGGGQLGPALAWQRVLALEVLRSLSTDAQLMRYYWRQYDDGATITAHTAPDNNGDGDGGGDGYGDGDGGGNGDGDGDAGRDMPAPPPASGLVGSLVTHLRDVVLEEPGLLDQEVLRDEQLKKRTSDEKLSTANTLYQAAAGVLGGIKNLSDDASHQVLSVVAVPAMQVLDQLDKSEAPTTASEYPPVLALFSLYNLAHCCANEVGRAFDALRRTAAVSGPTPPLPITPSPASELTAALPADSGIAPDEMGATRHMVEVISPAILGAFSFAIKTRCDDAIFAETLAAWQAWATAAGLLGFGLHRDALLDALAVYAVPAGVVAAMGSPESRGLSGRNVAALLALLRTLRTLSGSLGAYWAHALTTMGAATFILREHPEPIKALTTHKADFPHPALPFSVSPVDPETDIPVVLVDATPRAVHSAIADILFNTSALPDAALTQFFSAATDVSAGGSAFQPSVAESVLTSLGLPVPDPLVKRKKPLHPLYVDTRGHSILLPFIVQAWRCNRDRLVRSSPELGWNIVVAHLLQQVIDEAIPVRVRLQAATLLDELMITATDQSVATTDDEDDQARIQTQILRAMRCQAVLLYRRATAVEVEIRQLGLESLHKILDVHGSRIVAVWAPVFDCCYAACSDAPPDAHAPDISVPKGKHYTSPSLVKMGFSVLMQVASPSLIVHLTDWELRVGLDVLTAYMVQHDDSSVALSAVAGVQGVVADLDRRAAHASAPKSSMWTHLFSLLASAPALDDRPDVRAASITGQFSILVRHGHSFAPALWQEILLAILFPLLATLRDRQLTSLRQVRHQLDTSRQQQADKSGRRTRAPSVSGEAAEWSQHALADARERAQAAVATRALALQGLGQLLSQVVWTIVLSAPAFESIWSELLSLIDGAVREGPAAVSQAALDACVCVVEAEHTSSEEGDEASRRRFFKAQEAAWEKCLSFMRDLRTSSGRATSTLAHVTQDNLLSVVRAVGFIYGHTQACFDLPRLRSLFDGLNAVLLFSPPARRDRITAVSGHNTIIKSDVDSMSALQIAVRKLVLKIDTSVEGAKALLLRQVAHLVSLAFLPDLAVSSFSYVALCKTSLGDLQELFITLHTVPEVYTQGAFVGVLETLAVPIEWRYRCPPAGPDSGLGSGSGLVSDGEDRPLWQQALLVACHVLRSAIPVLEELRLGQANTASEAWSTIVTVLEKALEPNLDQEKGEARSFDGRVHERLQTDQVFDLVLLSTIETVVLDAIGSDAVPDATIEQFGRALVRASSLYTREQHEEEWEDVAADTAANLPQGMLDPIQLAPRELTAYWVLDLLILACTVTRNGALLST